MFLIFLAVETMLYVTEKLKALTEKSLSSRRETQVGSC
jgi:hypothetical protein